MQQLTIAGNVGRDAELRSTQSGEKVLGFSLAVDNGKDKTGNKRESTWFDCSIWGVRAEKLAGHITKGSKMVLTGRPTAREHGGKVYLGITVNDLTFMGGGSDRQDSEPSGSGQPSGGRPGGDYEDDVPFSPEWRI